MIEVCTLRVNEKQKCQMAFVVERYLQTKPLLTQTESSSPVSLEF